RRDAPYLLEIMANWSEPGDAEHNIAWARSLFEALAPVGTGKPNLNFPGLGAEEGFTRAALDDGWDRLVELKRRYDPNNLFRMNQNIRP
ncbi:FAD-linked oxidase, partial [Enterococcus hirae]